MTRHDWLRPTFTRHSEIYFKHKHIQMFYLHILGYLYLSLVLLADTSTSSAKRFNLAFLVRFLLLRKVYPRLFFHRKRLLSPPPSDNGLTTHNLYTAYALNLLTLHDLFQLLKRELLIFPQYLTGSVTGIMYTIQARCHPIYTWLFSRLFKIRVQLL